MHELSLALEVCSIAERHLAGRDGSCLRRVGVEVGDDSNVEVDNFRFCLAALLGEPPFGHAEATITTCPGTDLRLAWLEVDDDDSGD